MTILDGTIVILYKIKGMTPIIFQDNVRQYLNGERGGYYILNSQQETFLAVEMWRNTDNLCRYIRTLQGEQS